MVEAPEGMVAELIGGELHLQPRPARSHWRAASYLHGVMFGPYELGRDGPGGWLFGIEPEIHLGQDIVVPDIAGWRRTSLQNFDARISISYETVAPDWVCEILSKSTARKDREKKVPLYAREGVGHVWLLDPRSRMLEVLQLKHERLIEVANLGPQDPVQAVPFEAVEILARLDDLWTSA